MTLPTDYANETVSLDNHPNAHNQTNAAVNALQAQVDTIELTPGPPGADGPQGDPGPAGGALLAAFWTFNATHAAPPATGQVRIDNTTTPTTVWIHETDTDGFARAMGLDEGAVSGHGIMMRGANGMAANLTITGTPTDAGSYRVIPVTKTSGAITTGSRTQVMFVTSVVTIPDPSTGSPGDILVIGEDGVTLEWAEAGLAGVPLGYGPGTSEPAEAVTYVAPTASDSVTTVLT